MIGKVADTDSLAVYSSIFMSSQGLLCDTGFLTLKYTFTMPE
jgi:hypothetical protein